MVRVAVVTALALTALAGCTSPRVLVETQIVEVPVFRERAAPAELAAPYVPRAVPVFVAPSHPDASSALTPEGERNLRGLLIDLTTRDAAWRAWADMDAEEGWISQ